VLALLPISAAVRWLTDWLAVSLVLYQLSVFMGATAAQAADAWSLPVIYCHSFASPAD